MQCVFAVPQQDAGEWIAFFARICLASKAARTFRRDFGSGLKVGKSAAEQMQEAASSSAGKAALAFANSKLVQGSLDVGLGMVGLSTKRLKQAAQIAYEVTETANTIRLNMSYLKRDR